MISCVHFSSSSCYVAPSANLKVAGRRIAWGKYVNVGKMCLAPNYVLCLKAAEKEYYGEVCVSVCASVCVYCTCMCMYMHVYVCVCLYTHVQCACRGACVSHCV